MRSSFLSSCAFVLLFAAPSSSVLAADPAPADGESQILAKQLADVLSAAEKVIADNQDLIDDPAKGDKGLGTDVVLTRAAANYQAATGQPFPTTDGDSRRARLTKTLITIIRGVMDKAQPLINEQGKGYKSFLPPIFTDQVAREFSRTVEAEAVIRITAPAELIRNRRHRPDEWEVKVFEAQFKPDSADKAKAFIERVDYKGKAGVRLMLPQYYDQSCLKCHGEPKGERDINGGTKEGKKLGDLGGGISVAVFDDKK